MKMWNNEYSHKITSLQAKHSQASSDLDELFQKCACQQMFTHTMFRTFYSYKLNRSGCIIYVERKEGERHYSLSAKAGKTQKDQVYVTYSCDAVLQTNDNVPLVHTEPRIDLTNIIPMGEETHPKVHRLCHPICIKLKNRKRELMVVNLGLRATRLTVGSGALSVVLVTLSFLS